MALLRDTVGREYLRTQVAFYASHPKPELRGSLSALWADALAQAGAGIHTGSGRSFGIKQVVLEDFRYPDGRQRIDRCMSCHVAIASSDPAFRANDVPHPYRAHPGDYLEHHPVEKYGCTICHQGQGIALRADPAHGYHAKRGKDGAREFVKVVKHVDHPLLLGQHVEAACIKCHQGGAASRTGARRDRTPHWTRGKQLFAETGCLGCHSLHGKGGTAAPDLTEVGSKFPDQFDMRHLEGLRTVQNWLYEHFLDPQRVVAADEAIGIRFPSDMPNAVQLGISEQDARDLTTYLLSLTGERMLAAYVTPAKPEPAPTFASRREYGRWLYRHLGCIGCHGKEGVEDDIRKNWNAVGGVVPKLGNLSDKYSRAELKEFILRGSFPPKADESLDSPPLWMPAWRDRGITDEQLEALMDHLFTIKLKKKPGEAALDF